MRRETLLASLGAVSAVLLFTVVTGCPSGTVPLPPSGGTLTLSLDSALDGGGTVKATSITGAELLDSSGTVVVAATMSGGSAVFSLAGVTGGEYFIRVNGLDDDLVPTHIDDPMDTITQFTGQTLRVSVIGSESDPTYRIKTFSQGQNEHPLVKYSDGTDVSPTEYVYALLSLKTTPQKLSLRSLGTGTELNSFSSTSGTHPGTGDFLQPFATWVLHVQSPLHHGDAFAGVDTNCNTCHGNLDTQAASFSGIAVSNGWCFRCHYGDGGDEDGFVEPNQ
jgi:hypothetical protein